MKYLRIPIKDEFEDDYCYELFSAAKEINRVCSSSSMVYVHCGSGVSRAPTLSLVFLCIFKKIENWKILYSAYKYLQNFLLEI